MENIRDPERSPCSTRFSRNIEYIRKRTKSCSPMQIFETTSRYDSIPQFKSRDGRSLAATHKFLDRKENPISRTRCCPVLSLRRRPHYTSIGCRILTAFPFTQLEPRRVLNAKGVRPWVQDRLTRDGSTLSRNPASLRPSKIAFDSLLLLPRLAPQATPLQFTLRAST